MTVDVIILTYKPKQKFLRLMDRLMKQTLRPEKIIIINTEKALFEKLISVDDFLQRYTGCEIIHLKAAEFDHGNSRNLGVSLSRADCFVLMTQDAVPAGRYLLERLTAVLADEKTAVAYARQRPGPRSNRLERYTRRFNYGSVPLYKTGQNVAKVGIKAYFCSNVCSGYNAEIFRNLGGFVRKTIFNEDMIYAAGAIEAGYAVQYVPMAQIYHSHDYTARQQFERNFDLGVSHAQYPQIFERLATESEGVRLVLATADYLLKTGAPWLIFKLLTQSLAKYMGYFLGKRYRKLPAGLVRRFSMNKNYWS